MNETNTDATQPYTMNPLNRFSDRATDYAKYRANYPEDAIATILKELGNPLQLLS